MNIKYTKSADAVYRATEQAVNTLRAEMESEGQDVSTIAPASMMADVVAQVLLQCLVQERLAFNPDTHVEQSAQEALLALRQMIVMYRNAALPAAVRRH